MVSISGITVSLKTDLRFPITGQQGHESRNIQLKNPQAANDLLDKVDAAIIERLPVAESLEPYHSIRDRKYAYHRIYVDNYTIYCAAIDDASDDLVMEVRRFLYNGQNRNELL